MPAAGFNGPEGGLGQALNGMAYERMYFLADRIEVSSRFGSGVTAQVDTSKIPLRDMSGRFAHVTDLVLATQVQFVSTVTTSVSVTQQLGLIDQVYIEDVTGHQYIAGLDMRDARDDILVRQAGVLPTFLLTNAAYASATTDTTTATQTVYYQVQFSDFDVDGNPLIDGAIPLAAMRAHGNQAIRFRNAGAFKTTITSVTPSFVNTVRAFLGIVYLDHLTWDSPWFLDNYTITENDGSLRYPEAITEYALLYPRPEDTGGAVVTDYAGITVQQAGQIPKSAFTLAESWWHDVAQSQWDRSSTAAEAGAPASATPCVANVIGSLSSERGLYLVHPQKNRKGSTYGTVSYSFTTRSTHTNNRFLQRCVFPVNARRNLAMEAAAKLLNKGVEAQPRALTATAGPSPRVQAYIPQVAVKK